MSKQLEMGTPNNAAFGVSTIVVLAALLASFNGAAAQNLDAFPPMPGTLEAVAPATEKSQATGPTDSDEAASEDGASTQGSQALDEKEAAALREALSGKDDDESSTYRGAHPIRKSSARGLDWNRAAKSDGTTYTVKRALPVDWDTKVGADLGVNDNAAAPAVPALSTAPKNTGAAWANVQVPGFASFDARVSAGSEPSKFGLSRTVPLGGMASLTMQGSYAMTEASSTATTWAPPSSTPAIRSNDREVKLNFTPTGTSFGVGASNSSADNITHNKLSAEQKLFDKFNITTTLSDPGTAASSRSITAGFTTKW